MGQQLSIQVMRYLYHHRMSIYADRYVLTRGEEFAVYLDGDCAIQRNCEFGSFSNLTRATPQGKMAPGAEVGKQVL